MRILTWNMDHWRRSGAGDAGWDYMLNTLMPAIALLQEVRPPARGLDSGQVVFAEVQDRRGNWGSAVFAADGLSIRPLRVDACHPGAVVAAEVEGPQFPGTITAISIYGLLERILGTEYSITSLHRTLSDLTPLLDDPARRGNIILGGDLNASLAWDRRQKSPTHRLLFERIEAFGLDSCAAYRDEFHPTWRNRAGDLRWQIDYLFVSRELMPQVAAVSVVSGRRVDELSDHCPIVIEVGNSLAA